jgi:hypothetical protein
MQLHLLIFSLFSIIGSIQGSEFDEFNPNFFDFGTGWFISADDKNPETHEQEQIAHSALPDWSDFGDEIKPSVDTSEQRKHGRPYEAAVKIKVVFERRSKKPTAETLRKPDDRDKNRKRKRVSHDENSDTGIKKKVRGSKYPEEFKMKMVKLYEAKPEGMCASEFYREHDIPGGTLRDWIKKSKDQQ